MNNVSKILNNMDMQIINLEIQLAQISDDASARGAMVAAEHLKRELELLKKEFESCNRLSF